MTCCGDKVKQIISKTAAIVEGNALLAADTVFKLPRPKYEYADVRLAICRKCDKHIFILKRLFCGICKCWCPAKAFVKEEKCPLNLWETING